MKKIFLFLCLFLITGLGCDLSVTPAPAASPVSLPANTAIPAGGDLTPIPATSTSVPTLPPASPTSAGVDVSAGPLSIVLPQGLALGAYVSQVPRAEGQDLVPWEVTPGHTVLELDGYPLQGKTHQPRIYIYPALDYATMLPGAFESIHRLDNILYGPAAPLSAEGLPGVPFFNAQQLFASNIQAVSFQNGGGVRFLTEYAQYAAPANNQDLFYHFQGVSRDGAYYIIAILPVSNASLAETSDGGAVLPSGGIPYPDFADPAADVQSYYAAVSGLLEGSPAQAFAPALDQLDLLIQSMQVTP